jgi:hypothetical protein
VKRVMKGSDLINRFQTVVSEYDSIVGSLPEEHVEWQPSPNEWSIKQITFHLADALNATTERIRVMLVKDTPALLVFDADKWAAERHYQQRLWSDALADFRKQSSKIYNLLISLEDIETQRKGIHLQIAKILRLPSESLTVKELICFEVAHIKEHLKAVYRIIDSVKRS